MIVAKVIFWICFAVCVYIYFGYPAMLWLISRFRNRPVREADVTPRATFVIAAYNEEGVIGKKIENVLSLDYPSDKLEILVVSNGCTDRTCEVVRRYTERGYTDPRVRLIELEQPGKMQAVNEGVRQADRKSVV